MIKEPKDVPCDNVRNHLNPDSSYNAYHGQGYLVQVMETYCASEEPTSKADFITHFDVHKMTIGDSKAVEPAVQDTSERGIRPQLLLGDTRYGSENSRQKLSDEGVQLVVRTQPPKGYKKGKLTLEQFQLDEEGLIVKCPAGQAPMKRGESPRVQYTPDRVEKCRQRECEQSEAFKRIYRWRAGIEATISRLKHQMDMAELRVRGMNSVRYTVRMRCLGLNILRAANYV